MYNILKYPYYERVNILDELSRKIHESDKGELCHILDNYFDRKRLDIKGNSIEISVSAISNIIGYLYFGKTLNENFGKIPHYDNLNKEVALRMECSPNYKDYSYKIKVGSLEITLFGRPDMFCGDTPGEIKAISVHSPKYIEEYQRLKGSLQARIYAYMLGSQTAILVIARYRRYNDSFHIETIKYNSIDVNRRRLENLIERMISRVVLPCLYEH